jgi:hypothetical protein
VRGPDARAGIGRVLSLRGSLASNPGREKSIFRNRIFENPEVSRGRATLAAGPSPSYAGLIEAARSNTPPRFGVRRRYRAVAKSCASSARAAGRGQPVDTRGRGDGGFTHTTVASRRTSGTRDQAVKLAADAPAAVALEAVEIERRYGGITGILTAPLRAFVIG